MNTASRPAGASRLATAASWLLRIAVALVFGAAAFLKLSGNPRMVAEFGEIGLGQGFRYLTGLIEVIGAVLLLVPRTVGWGVLVLLGISAGALVAQVWVLHGDLVHVLVLAILLALIGWLRARG